MRRLILSLFLICAFFTGLAFPLEPINFPSLFDDAFRVLGKVDLVMTNVGYVAGSELLLDDFYKEILKRGIPISSIVNLHSPYNKPVYLAFLNKESGRLFYVCGERKVVEKVDYESVLSEADKWDERMKSKFLDGNEFSLLGVSQLFAFDVPYDLHKSIEFHNHVCPGLLSGYLIAELLKKEAKPNERLMVFAVPPWCKDDALQVIFDATVGKKGMYVRELKSAEKEGYPDVAGIYVFWNEKENKGRALALSFDFSALRKEANSTDKDYPWLSRLKQNRWIMKNLVEAKKLVGKIAEFEVDEKLLERLKRMEFDLKEVLKR